ncbi:MAG: YaiI/YqxD family protein [Clostridia bacterium]
MKILVDADACPVKEVIVKIAKQYNLPVTMFIDTSHQHADGYSTVVTVDKGPDSVDFALVNRLEKNDIVVTQDYGLAAMCIGKGAKALNQNGLVYSDLNMDKLLFERHLGQKIRRGGGRTAPIKKRMHTDNETFERAFVMIVTEQLARMK